MEKKYIAPLTEIVFLSAENILEGEGNQDSHGTDDPGTVDANTGSFNEDEITGTRSLWDD